MYDNLFECTCIEIPTENNGNNEQPTVEMFSTTVDDIVTALDNGHVHSYEFVVGTNPFQIEKPHVNKNSNSCKYILSLYNSYFCNIVIMFSAAQESSIQLISPHPTTLSAASSVITTSTCVCADLRNANYYFLLFVFHASYLEVLFK